MSRVRVLAAAGLVALALTATAGAGVPTFPAQTISVSGFGKVLAGANRVPLYTWSKERDHKVHCTGACAKAWPPYVVKSRPRAGTGVAGAHLGTIRRPGGRLQVTYFGHPLYYYVGDTRPGQILCQNVTEFGGIWRVVRPSGRLVHP